MENHYNCIYMYTNLINGKKYVGKAKNFNERHKGHLKGDKQLIDKKINEYGIENFKVEILAEDIDDSKIDEYEKFFIKRKRSHVSLGEGYNRTWGGDGGNTISGYTEEQRKEYSKKLSKTRKGELNPMYGVHRYGKNSPNYGHKRTEESKKRQSENISGDKHPMYGKPRSEETKRKISETKKGKSLSEEHKKHLSEAFNGEKNPNAHKVICLETNEIFNTIKDANEWLGKGNVSACCRGRCKTAGGYHWMFYEEWLQEQNENKEQDLVTTVA